MKIGEKLFMVKRKKSHRKLWWGVGIIVVIVAIGGGVYAMNLNKQNDEAAKETEVVETEDTEEETEAVEAEITSTGAEKEKVEQYAGQNSGESPNEAEELTGVVSYAGVSEGILMIRVSIDQYLESGECTLTLLRGGVTIYSSIANIVGNATTSTCEGFDVSVAELSGEGAIQININLSSGEKTGVIQGEEVNI